MPETFYNHYIELVSSLEKLGLEVGAQSRTGGNLFYTGFRKYLRFQRGVMLFGLYGLGRLGMLNTQWFGEET